MHVTWFFFSIFATASFGIAMALYKLPAARKINRFAVASWSLFVPALLSLFFFRGYLALTSPQLVWVALLWGLTFSLIVSLQMHALHHVDTNVLFPITTSASLVLTVVIGLLYFRDSLSPLQGIGTGLAVLAVMLFLIKGSKLKLSVATGAIGSGIIFLSAFNKVLQKIMADHFDIHAFQIYQYLFATFFSLVLFYVLHRKAEKTELFSRRNIQIGSLIGVFSFSGGYALYLALTTGPFSLITAIHSLYIFVTSYVAALLFDEKLSRRKVLLLLLAIVAIFLIHLG